MPSEKLTSILRSKSPFSEAEIAAISEIDGWNWVYQNKPAPKDKNNEICFTGFGAIERKQLEMLAGKSGQMKVKESVTTTLTFLCIGDNPGPAKLEKAKRQGVTLLSRKQFFDLLS
jgi:BRCT domain type II-containing protein